MPYERESIAHVGKSSHTFGTSGQIFLGSCSHPKGVIEYGIDIKGILANPPQSYPPR